MWYVYNITFIEFCMPFMLCCFSLSPGPTFIKPDQRNPWIKDQLWNDLLSTILHLQLPNFVSCGRDKPSHMTQNLVTVGFYLILDPWITLIRFDKSRAWFWSISTISFRVTLIESGHRKEEYVAKITHYLTRENKWNGVFCGYDIWSHRSNLGTTLQTQLN